MTKERLLYVLAFVMDGCFGLVGLSVPLLALSVGATYEDLGTIGAIGAAVYAASCLTTGRFLQKWPHQRTAAIGAAGVTLCFIAYTFAQSVLHIALVAAAVGLVLSTFWPTVQSWIAEGTTGERLNRVLGKFNVCWGAGVMVGPALGGQFYELSPRLPFMLSAVVVLCLFVGLLFLRPTSTPRNSRTATHPNSDQRFLTVSWIANFATFFAIGLVRSLFPKYATDNGIDPTLLGYLMALVGLSQVVSFSVVSRGRWWQNRLLPMVIIQSFGALGLVLLYTSNSAVLFALSLLMIGLLNGATFTFSMFYSLRNPSRSRTRAGVHEAIVGSGFLFGPLIGGLTAEHMGPSVPYLLGAVVILAAAGSACAILGRRRSDALA